MEENIVLPIQLGTDIAMQTLIYSSLATDLGTIVDAKLIAAQPSTKNRECKRDLDMHQSKKDNADSQPV